MLTVSVPVWLILIPVVWVLMGVAMHAVVYFFSPYHDSDRSGFGRGEDMLDLIAAVILWPVILVTLPLFFRDRRRFLQRRQERLAGGEGSGDPG